LGAKISLKLPTQTIQKIKMRTTLPITLVNQKILLIGGGKVAKHKAEVLKKNGVDFLAISKTFLSDFPESPRVLKEFQASDIADFSTIIDATGSDKVGAILREERKKRTLFINRVDKPDESDFFFNSLIIRDDLKISVSTSGKSPKMGQIIRDKIEKELPQDIGKLLENFGNDRANGEIDTKKVEREVKDRFKKVYLIGAGTGDPELLTIKAYRLLQSLDVIFYDHLISKEILNLIPKDVETISVGKQKGSHSKKQSEINRMIIDEVKQGKRVGRLKAGDPYIFGRGGEEFLYLTENGISVEVVAGVSSSTSFGLPPTLRGYSSGFTVVSAHLSGNRVNLEWVPLLKMENHTIIVLMGISRVKEIVKEANRIGVSQNLPALIVSNISRPNERRFLTDLSHLDEIGETVERPAIIIFGNIVALDRDFNKENYGE